MQFTEKMCTKNMSPEKEWASKRRCALYAVSVLYCIEQAKKMLTEFSLVSMASTFSSSCDIMKRYS